MPCVSVIIPVYHVEDYIEAAILSVLRQSFSDFEIIAVDDGGQDRSLERLKSLKDSRISVISQKNRGLAGARNTGIRAAQGNYVAFLDADDLWSYQKLEKHIEHMHKKPDLGISYCQSRLIDESGDFIGIIQKPRLTHITPADIFTRNPIGNGSVAFLRREVLEEVSFDGNREGEKSYFDEAFRQSEDIELWTRIALTTDWKFEGISGALTDYRINAGGLSANFIKQYESWLAVYNKLFKLNPDFIRTNGNLAHSYQLRYLARQAIRTHNKKYAWKFIKEALSKQVSILFREPRKTLITLMAAGLLKFLPYPFYRELERAALSIKRST